MALGDWLWLVRLIMEILKLIAALPADELQAIASLRSLIPELDSADQQRTRPKKTT